MAKVVEQFPKVPKSAGRYDWDEWGDGRIWELTHGVDYKCKATSLRQTATKEATLRGKSVRTVIIAGDEKKPERIIVQFVERKPGKRGRARP